MAARRWFHVLLGAVFLPVLSLPLVWGAALRCWRSEGDGEGRRWTARLLGLAAVDTLVALALLAAVVTDRPLDRATARPPPRLVIGVTPDPAFHGPGLRLGVVTPGGPAALAGVQVGDVLRTIDGEAIDSLESLQTLIAGKEAGTVVELGLLRGASASTIQVRTTWSDAIRPPRQMLFRPEKTGQACRAWPGEHWPWPETIALGALAVLAVVATLNGSGAGVWATALALLGSILGAIVGWLGTCVLIAGPSIGGALVALWGTSVGLGATALVGRTLARPVELPATRSVHSTVLLGLWYAFPGALRLVILLTALRALLPWGTPFSSPVEGFAQTLGGVEGPGLLLLAIGGIVLAPVGEELAFRGLLLPSLTGWAGTAGAIWISATVFGALHWYYRMMIPVTVFQGLVLGWARVVSGGLRAPILLHAAFNLIPFGLLALHGARGG